MQAYDENVIHGDPLPKIPNISFGQHVLNGLRAKQGDVVAQVDAVTGKTQTFHEIIARSVALAQRLRGLGVGPTDVVAICSENSLDYCVPLLATFYIGAACAPLNPLYTEGHERLTVWSCVAEEVSGRDIVLNRGANQGSTALLVSTLSLCVSGELFHAMSISKPVMAFASALTLPKIVATQNKLNCIRRIVLIGLPPPAPLPATCETLADFVSSAPTSRSDAFTTTQVDPANDTCLVLCSSGTTGLPKCVQLTHRGFICTLHAPTVQNDVQGVVLGLLPFYHGYGLKTLLGSLLDGYKVVVVPRFEPTLFLKTVQDYKISVLCLVPSLVTFLAKHPLVDQYDLSKVTTIISGAAPLSRETHELVSKRLGITDIRQRYAMTELSVGGTGPHGAKVGSSGQVVMGMSSKIVDVETGRSLPRNQKGEICFKGPLIMKGYLRNSEATAATIDSDGWLHTGDIGFYDEGGHLFVVDRLKELIKFKGNQVTQRKL